MAVQYRDLQRPTILETGLVDQSGAEYAQQLARTFKMFEHSFANTAGSLNAQVGEQRGMVEGAAGQPQVQSGWRAFTRYGQAYNSAAEVTYANKLQTDINDTLTRLELESEADPVKYQTLSSKARDVLMQTVPPEFAPRIGQLFDARMSVGSLRTTQQAIALHNEEAVASLIESMPTRVQTFLDMMPNLTPEASDEALKETVAEQERQLEALLASHAIGPERAAVLRAAFQKSLDDGITNQHITTTVKGITDLARKDVTQADAALAAIEARTDLSDEEKAAIRSESRQQRELLEYERGKLYYQETADLYQRLARDDFGPRVESEARRLYKLGAIGDGEYRSILSRSTENQQRVIKERAQADAAQEIIWSGAGQLDPANPEHKKAVNLAFENRVAAAGMQPGDDRWAELALGMTKNSGGILPESAESWARMGLLSGDPAVAARAAGFLGRVRDTNTAATAWSKEPKLVALSDLIEQNLEAGLPVDRAYELASRATYGLTPDEEMVRDRDLKRIFKEDPSANEDVLEDTFTEVLPLWFDKRSPALPVALRAEFESLVKQYYTASGDIEQARKAAAQDVKKNWGVTELDGERQLVKFPIEMNGFPLDVVRADLAATVLPFTDKKVTLLPSAATIRTRGREWLVATVDENGVHDVLRDDRNRIVEYALPSSDAEYERAKRRSAEAQIEEMYQQRAEQEAIDALRGENLPGRDLVGTPLVP